MRIAALYDIHANAAALQAVLEELPQEQVDAIVVGGDVLPGPQPQATLACLRGLRWPAYFLMGNGEREVLATRAGQPNRNLPEGVHEELAWCARQMKSEDVEWVSRWPASVTLTGAAGPVFFCHATFRNDTEIFTAHTPSEAVQRAFASVEASLIVCGHSHMPFDRRAGRWRILNAGSVGIPFGDRRASWLLLGERPELRATAYDAGPVISEAVAAGYPDGPGSALTMIREPPATEAMLALFAAAELK